MDEALWALGRGTGVAALVLMTASVVLGVTVRSGRATAGTPRFSTTLIHRNIAVLSTVFIAIHLVSLLFDSYAQLDVIDFFVPFLADYEPVWLGLGTLAVDLLIAIAVTSLLRHRIGPRAFRAVHWATYALWPIAFAHGIGSGSDVGEVWFVLLAGACAVAVVAAVGWRLTRRFIEFADRRAPREPMDAATGLASLAASTTTSIPLTRELS